MATYRPRSHDSPGHRILRRALGLAIGIPVTILLAVLLFVLTVWIWVGTAP